MIFSLLGPSDRNESRWSVYATDERLFPCVMLEAPARQMVLRSNRTNLAELWEQVTSPVGAYRFYTRATTTGVQAHQHSWIFQIKRGADSSVHARRGKLFIDTPESFTEKRSNAKDKSFLVLLHMRLGDLSQFSSDEAFNRLTANPCGSLMVISRLHSTILISTIA